jgi:transposase
MRVQKSPAEYGFTHHDRLRLQKALEQVNDKRIFVRLQAVLLFSQGVNINDIVQIAGKAKRAIYYWIERYLVRRQPADLFDKPRPGQPLVARQVTRELIREQLQHNPLDLGYHAGTWTVGLLAKHFKVSHGLDITERTLRRRMKQMGLRFKRPRYVYSEKDPNRAQKKGLSPEN